MDPNQQPPQQPYGPPQQPQQPYPQQQQPQQNPATSVYQPEVYNSPTLVNPQQPTGLQPYGGTSGAINDPDVPKSKRGLIIVAAAGIGLIVLLLIVVAVIGAANKKSGSNSKNGTAQTTDDRPDSLKPVQSLEVTQVNNAVSEDISRLDDEKDLPNNSLDDTTLGL